jgi:hypothetical protein
MLMCMQAQEAAAKAQERAAAAEQSKIELTLALAEAAEARAKDIDTHVDPPADVDTTAFRSSAGGASHTAGRGASSDQFEGGENADATAQDGGSSGNTVIAAAELEALMNRAEEARLAAAVQTRRAAAAEAEVDNLRKRLAEAERQVKDLGWQIQMVADPVTFGGARGSKGGAGGGGDGKAGWFGDMLGCGANFVRK